MDHLGSCQDESGRVENQKEGNEFRRKPEPGRSTLYLRTSVLKYNFKVLGISVGVKYNWSSTQILQVLVIKYKYKYFAFSPIKYSSTDTPSTSTSANIGWLIYTENTTWGGNSREIPPCPMITPVQYP